MDDVGKGVFAKRNWMDIQKSGGISLNPSELMKYLEGDNVAKLTREELIDRINGYLSSCIESYIDEDTGLQAYRWCRNPTKSGLARVIGTTLETLCRYVKGEHDGKQYKEDYPGSRNIVSPSDFDIVRAAYNVISEFYEGQLAYNKNNSGTIFWLLNKDNQKWSNQQEVTFAKADDSMKPVMSAQEIHQARLERKAMPQIEFDEEGNVIEQESEGF